VLALGVKRVGTLRLGADLRLQVCAGRLSDRQQVVEVGEVAVGERQGELGADPVDVTQVVDLVGHARQDDQLAVEALPGTDPGVAVGQ